MKISKDGQKLAKTWLVDETIRTMPKSGGFKAVFLYRRVTKKYQLFNPYRFKKSNKYPKDRAREVTKN